MPVQDADAFYYPAGDGKWLRTSKHGGVDEVLDELPEHLRG